MEKLKATRNPLKNNIDDKSEYGRIKIHGRIPKNNRIKIR